MVQGGERLVDGVESRLRNSRGRLHMDGMGRDGIKRRHFCFGVGSGILMYDTAGSEGLMQHMVDFGVRRSLSICNIT